MFDDSFSFNSQYSAQCTHPLGGSASPVTVSLSVDDMSASLVMRITVYFMVKESAVVMFSPEKGLLA